MDTIIEAISNAPQKTITLVLLAAGKSSRFKGIKLAQPIIDFNAHGTLIEQPLLLHSLDKLNYLADYLIANNINSHVVVVLGSHHKELSALLPKSTVFIINEQSEQGLSTSIKVGVKDAISTNASGLILALADHIGVSYSDYVKLADLWILKRHSICASYQSQLGVPALFTADQFSALAQLNGDKGAKPLLQQLAHNKQLTCLDLPSAINDIDTRDDLLKWQESKLNQSLT
ncbi:nucleotidyltransferase family protein [uncultured Psychromonas sp.]|uniref:nucleotidyltransferase family protein n=1 Tax=uncultured Psychromonas sp. TaxID=173974 RepID=UPI002612EA63|nr:nucleotidyltransferase family protein [uncultured Psychromonas sp.]